MKRSWIIILAVVLVIAFILPLSACGKGKTAEAPATAAPATAAPATPAPTAKPAAPAATAAPAAPAAPAYADALEEIKAQIGNGEYYDAAKAVVACRETWPEASSECDELWQQIKDALADKRPETGLMERTYQYQGGNLVKISSEHGDIDLTITGKNKQGYARYYIREGESTEFYVPCYKFDVDYTEGEIWFDDEIGFGEFGEEGSYEDGLHFRYAEVPGWVIFHFAEGNPDVQAIGDRILSKK